MMKPWITSGVGVVVAELVASQWVEIERYRRINREVPPNDGSVSLGQATIAACCGDPRAGRPARS